MDLCVANSPRRTDTYFGLQGFVAVDTVREEIVVAFRGSSSTRNWIADLDFLLTPYSGCDGCWTHNGFTASWYQVKDSAWESVESAYLLYPNYTLVVTGHSLGAAVATLAGLEFRLGG